jgi:hypothetical protein
VEDELWDEFKVAYHHNRTHRDFLALVAGGIWAPVPNLSELKIRLQGGVSSSSLLRESIFSSATPAASGAGASAQFSKSK